MQTECKFSDPKGGHMFRRASFFTCSLTSNGLDLELVLSTFPEAHRRSPLRNSGVFGFFHHSITKIEILTMYLRGGVEGS